MMQLTARQVRAYKGAAISILMLLMVERRPLSQGEMRRGTAYHDEAINDAVWMLREDGLIVETGRYTWSLLGPLSAELQGAEAAGYQQLPIGATDALAEETGDHEGRPYQETANCPELGPDDPELALNESMNESLTDSIEDDSLIDEPGPEIPELANEKSLLDLRFYGKGIQDMLAIPGLTMREVRYQVEHSPNLGCALARIRKRQLVPEIWERAGPGGGSRYVSTEFADFVRH